MLESIFQDLNPVLQALVATTGTWIITALGAALIFLFEDPPQWLLDVALGFAGGVMVAASCWSLLIPSLERGGIVPALIGLVAGALVLFVLDRLLERFRSGHEGKQQSGESEDAEEEGEEGKSLASARTGIWLLVIAITLHDFPEGAAVGVSFGRDSLGAAIALALGIGLQNFPEGLAVTVPLRKQGFSRWKAFLVGQLSAIVEPIAGVLGVVLVTQVGAVLPYALSFAAGAMLLIVVQELIPETAEDRMVDAAALGFIAGFAVMMTLDVTLG
jgi:ZIP family zinc transporter